MSTPENQTPPKSKELGISVSGIHSAEDLEQIEQLLHERSVPYLMKTEDNRENTQYYTLTLPLGAFEHATRPGFSTSNGQEGLFVYAKAKIVDGKVSPEVLSIGGILRDGLVHRVEGQSDDRVWENPNFSDIETSEAA